MKKLILATMLCLGLAGVTVAQPAFESTDLGTPAMAGSAVVNPDGSVTVTGGGTDIWGENDQGHFAYVEVSGDLDVYTRVTGVSGGDNGWRKFGVMIRNELASNSSHAFNACTTANGIAWQGRKADGANGNYSGQEADNNWPYGRDATWVRMVRKGNQVTAYWSVDGINWTTPAGDASNPDDGDPIANPQQFTLEDPVYVGLAVTAHDDDGTEDELTAATFDNFGIILDGELPEWGAVNWDPSPMDADVPVGVITLDWDTIVPEGSTIRDYRVYFGTDPNLQEASFLDTVTDSTIDSPALSNDTTYYWRVASYIDDSNWVPGTTVQFSTISYGPVITQQPQDAKYGPACEAELTLVAGASVPGEGGDIHYAWYRVLEGDDALVGADSDTYVTDVDGEYYCVVSNDIDSVASETATVSASSHATVGEGDGQILYEQFPGNTGADTILGADSADADHTEMITASIWGAGTTGSPDSGRDNYRGRITLWLMPLVTGDYEFRVAGDDDSRLWLSSDAEQANAVRIAGFDGWTNIDAWDTYDTQTSDPIALQRGGVYFLRAGNNEGGGGDYIHVQWKGPGFDWQDISGPVVNSVQPDRWAVQNIAYAPIDANGWVDYDAENVTFTWEQAPYGPCDGVYTLYLSQDEAVVNDPNAEGALAFETSDLSVVVPNIGTLDLQHDQTWYYRIDVDSATAGKEELGLVYSFDTIKWVPLIATQPPASVVTATPADVTISCTGSALDDDFAVLTNYTWYRVVGDKDAEPGAGDDELIFSQDDPAETNRGGGKRFFDCSVELSVTEIGHEGLYYCVTTNASGVAVSNNCLLLIERKVLEYTFESLNGNTVPDSSPSGFDGTLVAETEGAWPAHGDLVPGIIGNAIKLIGGEDPNAAYVDSGKTALQLGIEGARPRSVSVWVKTGDMARSGVYSVGIYNASMQTFGVHNANDLGVSWTYQFDHWGSNWDYTGWVFDQWIHIVHVYDGANVKIYINGEKLADYGATLNTAAGGAGGQPFAVGFWGQYSGVQHGVFNGLIDEIALYNYALSPQEIGQLYIAGAGGTACVEAPQYDLTGDCQVDLEDFAEFAASWAESSLVSP